MTALPQGSAPGSTADEPAGAEVAPDPTQDTASTGAGTVGEAAVEVAEGTEDTEASGPGTADAAEPEHERADGGADPEAGRPEGAEAGGEGETGTEAGGASETGTEAGGASETGADGGDGSPGTGDAKASELTEAAAELAAQRELRARIEQRKAEREAPIPAGTKLSGQAADLLAAVRAVESGEKASSTATTSTPSSAPAP
ncbi:hypothetical protein ABZ726_21215 [Streptomyces hundungensis]|uniref:hypothetical protein n=1 Tax=Streptomyces hundungensis TaxID=1077946 RepID=UPI0033D7BF5B